MSYTKPETLNVSHDSREDRATVRQHAQKFSKDRASGSGNIVTDRQTDTQTQTDRHTDTDRHTNRRTHHNTLQPPPLPRSN